MTITVKKCSNTGNDKHFDNGHEFYYQPVVNGKVCSYIAESEDMAILVGMGIKYDGIDSQFPKMAARMLGIKTEWA